MPRLEDLACVGSSGVRASSENATSSGLMDCVLGHGLLFVFFMMDVFGVDFIQPTTVTMLHPISIPISRPED